MGPSADGPETSKSRRYPSSETRIDRLTFHRKDAENALMHACQRLVLDKPVQGLKPKGKLAQGHRAFMAKAALLQPFKVLWAIVVRAIYYPEVFPATTLHRWLEQSLAPTRDEVSRLHDHTLAPVGGHGFPPGNRVRDLLLIV